MNASNFVARCIIAFAIFMLFDVQMPTGARCVATLLHEMKRRGKDCRFGVVSMCIGAHLSLTHSMLNAQNLSRAHRNVLIVVGR